MNSKLTAMPFYGPADVPPVAEWLANISNTRTRCAYRNDVQEFMKFADIGDLQEFLGVDRDHVLAWRLDLQSRGLRAETIRRKLSSLSSLFDSLHGAKLIPGNPAEGLKRRNATTQVREMLVISDTEARALLAAPDGSSLQGLRDRAIVATLLYHGLRRTELSALRVTDLQERRGMRYLQVHGNGNTIRHVLLRQIVAGAIVAYLDAAGHSDDEAAPLFRPVSNNTRSSVRSISPEGVYVVVARYASIVGIGVDGFGPRALRTMARINTSQHDGDLANFQEWARHEKTSARRIYEPLSRSRRAGLATRAIESSSRKTERP